MQQRMTASVQLPEENLFPASFCATLKAPAHGLSCTGALLTRAFSGHQPSAAFTSSASGMESAAPMRPTAMEEARAARSIIRSMGMPCARPDTK